MMKTTRAVALTRSQPALNNGFLPLEFPLLTLFMSAGIAPEEFPDIYCCFFYNLLIHCICSSVLSVLPFYPFFRFIRSDRDIVTYG